MLVLLVKCPKCGFEQQTTTVKKVRCFRCNTVYNVYCKTKKGWKSRIVKIVEGSYQELFQAFELMKLEKIKKRLKSVE